MTTTDPPNDRHTENPYRAPLEVRPSGWLRHPVLNYLNNSPVGLLIGIPVGMLIGLALAWVLAVLAMFLSDLYGIDF